MSIIDDSYLEELADEVLSFQKIVQSTGIDIIKDILDDKWFVAVMENVLRVSKDEGNETYTGEFFPYRWLFQEERWFYINETLGRIYETNSKKRVLREKIKNTARNDMMPNVSAAFEIEILCRLFSKGFIVDIEPKIGNSTKKADALIRIDKGREIYIEASGFEPKLRSVIPTIGAVSVTKNIKKIVGKINDKYEDQLAHAEVPAVLIIKLPEQSLADQRQAGWAMEEIFASNHQSLSAVIISDTYLFRHASCYYNENAKHPLSETEWAGLCGCVECIKKM